MGVEQTIYDFHDIVPKARGPTFVERHLPTFLGLACRLGYSQPAPEPEIEQRDYPAEMTVRMPEIPRNAGEGHCILYFFERVGELADRMQFNGHERRLRLKLDERSYENVRDVPFHGDGTMGGNSMFHAMAIFQYAGQWFGEKGYRVTRADLDFDNVFDLGLQKI